jgi:peptidoglycan/LPS O-acetylase OafA/YrhL
MRSGDGWRLGHRPALDGLRGIAILMVLITHSEVPYTHQVGGAGVTLFFVLSGFLITALLLEEHERSATIDLRAFYVRRVRRLGPAFAVMLAVAALVGAVTAGSGFVTLPGLLFSMSYVGNWVMAFAPGVENAFYSLGGLIGTWSLAVEEQFYLLWPMAMILALRRSEKTLAVVAAVGLAGSVAARVVLDWSDAAWYRIYYATDTNAAPLLIGCLLALWLRRRGGVRHASPAVVAALVGIAAACTLIDVQMWLWNGLVIAFLAGVAVLGAGAGRVGWLTAGWLRWFGSRSYGIYLWNCLPSVATDYVSASWLELQLLVTLPSLVLAELSWRCVETPFRRSKAPRGLPAGGKDSPFSKQRVEAPRPGVLDDQLAEAATQRSRVARAAPESTASAALARPAASASSTGASGPS